MFRAMGQSATPSAAKFPRTNWVDSELRLNSIKSCENGSCEFAVNSIAGKRCWNSLFPLFSIHNQFPKLNVLRAIRLLGVTSENGGANRSAVGKAVPYRTDSKKCFGIIRAALSLLKSVHDFPHNPKVSGSNPPPATNKINNLHRPLEILRAQ